MCIDRQGIIGRHVCERGEVWGGYDSVACDMYVLDRRHEWEYRSRGGGAGWESLLMMV